MRESVEKTNHIKNEWKEANKVAERIGCSFHITKMQYIIKHSHSRAHTHFVMQKIHYISHISTNLLWRVHIFLSTALRSTYSTPFTVYLSMNYDFFYVFHLWQRRVSFF